jgi:hypothetical protein
MNNKHEFVLIYEPKLQKTPQKKKKKNPQDIFLLPSFLPLRKFVIVFIVVAIVYFHDCCLLLLLMASFLCNFY